MNAPPSFDTVIFDLDGTLVATDGFWIPAASAGARRAFGELGVERALPSPQEWMRLVGLPMEEGFAQLFSDLSKEQREHVAACCIEEEERLLRAGGAALLPGVEECLSALHSNGIRLAIASNCGSDYLRTMLGSLGLERWIEAGRCLESPGVRSKADMLEDIVSTFGSRSAVMVGDRGVDSAAARAVALPFVHYDSGTARVSERVDADARIASMDELQPVLARRGRRLDQLIDELGLLEQQVLCVGVTGHLASGKTLLARDLARRLSARGRTSRVVARGGRSPQALRDDLLESGREGRAGRLRLDAGGELVRVPSDALLVIEGPELLDPALRPALGRVLFLELSEERRLERIEGRDGRLEGPAPVERARQEVLPRERHWDRLYPPTGADRVLAGADPLHVLDADPGPGHLHADARHGLL